MTNTIASIVIITSVVLFFGSVDSLHEDQVGKFDWRKKFIGVPKFVHHHSGSENLIIGTKKNVISAIHIKDGSIIWRQLLPKGCSLVQMTILKSSEDQRDFMIRTLCQSENGDQTNIWNPQNGLLASDSRYKELVDDDQAESLLTDEGHLIDNTRAFTITDDSSLLVSRDGKLTYQVRDDIIWSREESLASVVAVEFVTLPVDMRDSFGLRKRIVLVTEHGKIFGIDTFSGEIVWQIYDEKLSTSDLGTEAILIVTKQSDEDASASRAVVINPVGYVLHINPIAGQIIGGKEFHASIKQVAKTELDDVDGDRSIIMLDYYHQVHIFPEESIAKVRQNLYKYYLTIVERSPPTVEGFKFTVESDQIVARSIWNFPINNTETVVNLNVKRIDEEVHSPARVLGDRGLLYKYLNPNLVAVMTQGTTGDGCAPDHYINVYLIDGVTGALVHSVHHPKSRGPSNMVHSESWLVYSYYNTKSRRTEVSSLEMFEGTVQANSTAFSSQTRASIKPKLIEHKSFIFPSGIDAMIDTVTYRGMTNRHIIVALPSGALLEIPRIFLDPRRPINMLMEHREEGLIPYMPELPIPSESMINYDQTLLAVRKITTSPAMLESTSLVFSYGLDLFFTRVTPSKTFDILKDDFDHVLITAVLIFLVVASYISKLLAQRKALYAAWK